MGDFDDMNATPLGKLPLPAVQSKSDGPRADMGSSYADILKQMAAKPQPQPQQQQQPMAAMGTAMGMGMQADPFPRSAALAQHAPEPPVRYRKRHARYDDDDVDDYDEYRRPTRRGASIWWRLKQNKSSILVMLVVFAVLWYVAPKLAQMVPALLNASGKFNAMGLLSVAAVSGGLHRVADHYVKI